MKHNLSDANRIEHVLEAIETMDVLLKSVDFLTFEKNIEKRLAVERLLEIIGEASNHISEKIIYHPEISTPWRQIINTRNIIAHEYFRVDIEIIYKIATNNIIPLKLDIMQILKNLDKYLSS